MLICLNCNQDVPIYRQSIIYPWICIHCKSLLSEDEIMELTTDTMRELYAKPWPGGEA